MTNIAGHGQDRRISPEIDVRTLCLDPETRLVAVDQLHFDAPRRSLTR